MLESDWMALLRCPNCGDPLDESDDGQLDCTGCELPYPVLLGVPILVSSPHEWLASYRESVLAALVERHAPRREIEVALAFAEVGRGVEPRRFVDDWVASETGAPAPLPVPGPALGELDELLDRIVHCSLEATLVSLIPAGAELAVDLGCGAGHLTRTLAAASRRVVAVDHSLRAVAHAGAGSDGNISGLVADLDAPRLPLADGAADLVLAAHIFDIVGDAAGVMVRAARLLRPGGRLVAASPDPNLGLPDLPDEMPLLDSAVLSAGLEIDSSRDGVPWLRLHGPRHIQLYLTRVLVATLPE